MKNWLVSISITILIVSLSQFLLPDKRLGKIVKSIYSLLIFMLAIEPIMLLKNNNFSFDYVVNLNQNDIQIDYLEYVFNKKNENYFSVICDKLNEYNYELIEKKIEYLIDDNYNFIIKKINLTLKKVINKDNTNIDILDKVNSDIKNVFGENIEINIEIIQ